MQVRTCRSIKLVYFTDPMCSWCYGFGPNIRRLAEAFSHKMGLEIVPGGLRPGETRPMPEPRARQVLHHWAMVEKETGQRFDHHFFERHPNFVYDTLPSCRAVAAVNRIDTSKSLDFLEAIQRLFYAQGEDPTSQATLARAAEEAGVDAKRFSQACGEDETEKEMHDDFAAFQEAGGLGFPTVILNLNGRKRMVTIGYQPYEHLHSVVENILEKERNRAN